MSLSTLQRIVFAFLGASSVVSVVLLVVLGVHIVSTKPTPVLPHKQTADVLGISISTFPTPTPVLIHPVTPSPSLIPSPTRAPFPIAVGLPPTKSNYVIAVYGDSMEDTMGDKLDVLFSLLSQAYPKVHFSLYNYGIGAQNVADGLARFSDVFTYKHRNYPALSDIKPDIIVLGSYAYNPFSPPNPLLHKQLLTQMVEKAKSTGAKVYLLAEIAPLGTDFANGPSGMPAWTPNYRLTHAKEVLDQMENVFFVATQTNTPVIDVYDKTKTTGPFGNWQYTTNTDGIHPSQYGHYFMADMIVHSIF